MESDKNYCLSLLTAACLAGLPSCDNNAWSGYDYVVSGDDIYCDTLALSINELLFDPVGDGADYVEIVNVSDCEIDLSECFIHNRNSKGELGKGYALSDSTCMLLPGGYCLLTSDTASVMASYGFSEKSIWLQIKGFPSMPNAGGTVVLTDTSGLVIDECSYLPAMHHPLLSDREGVALEKLHPGLPSSQNASWASAASDVSYGTPGRPNSQLRSYLDDPTVAASFGGFFLPRAWLAPSSDDSTAFLTLMYSNIFGNQPVTTVEAYSRYGEKVAVLADNAILGTNGLYIWYGQDGKGNFLPAGQYILSINTYDLSGHVIHRSLVCSIIGELRS